MKSKIYSVESVNYKISDGDPARLVVSAAGTANSSGWQEGELIPWRYNDQPADGIVDFEFVAIEPKGEVLWVMSPIKSTPKIVEFEDWIEGVRVHSVTGPKEIRFDAGAEMSSDILLMGEDDPAPFPWYVKK